MIAAATIPTITVVNRLFVLIAVKSVGTMISALIQLNERTESVFWIVPCTIKAVKRHTGM
ncbi:hypothetical protein D3C78_1793140 [compost metagenome]